MSVGQVARFKRSADINRKPRPNTPAKYYAQQKRSRHAYDVEMHAEIVLEKAQFLPFHLSDGAEERLLPCIDAWLRAYPPRPATLQAVADHETGHYVAAQASGMMATCAQISGARGDWSGRAARSLAPMFDAIRGGSPYTAENALAEAVVTFAGPFAEFRHGSGDVYRSLGELVAVMLFVIAYLQIVDCKPSDALDLVVAMADDIHKKNVLIIQAASQKLKSRRCISAADPDIARLLKDVRPSTLKLGCAEAKSDRVRELRRLFSRAPVDLAPLLGSIFL